MFMMLENNLTEHTLTLAGIVPSMVDARLSMHHAYRKELEEIFKDKVLPSVRTDSSVPKAQRFSPCTHCARVRPKLQGVARLSVRCRSYYVTYRSGNMSSKQQFAPSALSRAAQGQIGARRQAPAEQSDDQTRHDNAPVEHDTPEQRDSATLQRSAMPQTYDLPLPAPRVKKEKPAHTSLYLPPDLLEWVKQYCFENDLSMNQIVCTYLEELRRRADRG